jgi:hypothetical protein
VALTDLEWGIVQVLSLANVVVLTIGLVLSIVAARGFGDAPFGRLLKPLPVVFVGFILVNAPWAAWMLSEIPYFLTIYALVFTVAAAGAMWASVQAIYLLTERREL